MPKKTLEDLEFDVVVENILTYCVTSHGKEKLNSLKPSLEFDQINFSLDLVSEYLSSLDNDNNFPNHFFESISKEIKIIQIINSQLEIDSFRKIKTVVELTILHIKFLKKFKTYYVNIYELTKDLDIVKEIVQEINSVIDKYGFIKDNATNDLLNIRNNISSTKSKIRQSFSSALNSNNSQGYLDEIKESLIDNRRVLAVKAMYRRKVKGQMMGSSKTGSIVYIEPQETLIQSRKLQDFLYDENEEIKKILKNLTSFLQPYCTTLTDYQNYLTDIDVIYAKAKYAKEINALKPNISSERITKIKDAFHPLLYSSNTKLNLKTYPQSISLDNNKRIIVVSGPNAGGKSITLKTIGLLQLMLQSGILIPVHHSTQMCVFDNIISDIGDNQSIENQLSTYSYRLKNMNSFLKKCNSKTLFLIDEFGTGSDPELGGALAEIFLEVFYERKSFGVITTHYSNLKLLANELPHMSNANMQFNDKTLEPTFNLVLGQAGSSFTFEVAQKNGIPYSIINRAKKKIERGKVRFDATIAKLQKQRVQLDKTASSLKQEEDKFKKENEKLILTNDKIKSKLINYQELFDSNQRMITVGNKLNDISERYFNNGKKRILISELLNLVDTLNSKRKKTNFSKVKLEKRKVKMTKEVLDKELQSIRKEKKKNKLKPVKKLNNIVFKVGDKVRIEGSSTIGIIDNIEKNNAVVNYDTFTTKTNISKLEFVK
ncbi:DNA mismatch repair protein MutS [Flavobacteriaceae bacterium]|nr:DNA mismatch repair protein MutS [Flavobacteriaceae bacterium]MDC0506721.1 DNA mismatch repair protein MutS [Flavobacteriaceae bacterium]MDC0631234.1 DNA mismatch repair protein MutS [Flavobacteriaceae bacterium]MDC0924380.1 DNA mismatch repair protein MutS [Flavobacteriaceae bacterium]